MIRVLIALAFVGALSACSSMPAKDSLSGKIEFQNDASKRTKIAFIDATMPPFSAPKDSISGALIAAESDFSPNKADYLRDAFCHADCERFSKAPIKVLAFDAYFAPEEREWGKAAPHTPTYIPPGTHPGAAAIGLLLGHGLVAIAGSKQSVSAHVRLSVEIDGKRLIGLGRTTASKSGDAPFAVRYATLGAISDLKADDDVIAEKIRAMSVKEPQRD
jgi:hypothetical protein